MLRWELSLLNND